MGGISLGYWRDKTDKGHAPCLVTKKIVYFDYYDNPKIEKFDASAHDGLIRLDEDYLVAPYQFCVWKEGG